MHKALAEFGRIDKTLHMFIYIGDEDERRATLIQLNRGEARHSVAREVFHGQRGELRQRYREGQEDQLGWLGLVTNVITLCNKIYTGVILDQLPSRVPCQRSRCRAFVAADPRPHQHARALLIRDA